MMPIIGILKYQTSHSSRIIQLFLGFDVFLYYSIVPHAFDEIVGIGILWVPVHVAPVPDLHTAHLSQGAGIRTPGAHITRETKERENDESIDLK